MPTPKKPTKKTLALLAKWQAVVESIEKGYAFGLFDYRNDLDVRSLLAATHLAGTEQAATHLAGTHLAGAPRANTYAATGATPSAGLAALDQRFTACLTAQKVKIWESDAPGAFWCYGYPKKTNREFKQDLKAEGLI